MPQSDSDASNGREGIGRRAASGVAWMGLGRWASQLASMLGFLVLARLLAPEDFGLIAMTGAFVGVAAATADFGFGTWIIQRRSMNPNDTSTAFWSGLVLAISIAAAFAACSPSIARLVGEPVLAPLLAALAATFPLNALSAVPNAILRKQFQFRTIMLRTLAATLLGLAAAITAAYAGLGAWSLVIQSIVSAATAAVVLWAASAWRPQMLFDRDSFRDATRFGSAVVGITVVGALWENIDTLILGVLGGATVAGVYMVARRIVIVVMGLFVGVITSVALPTFSKIRSEPRRLSSAYERFSCAQLSIACAPLAAVATTSPLLIPIAFGSQWQSAAPPAAILACGAMFSAGAWSDRPLLLGVGKPHYEFILTLGLIASRVPVMAVGFGAAGVGGAAWAAAIHSMSLVPVRLWTVGRVVPISISRMLRRYSRIWVAAAVSMAIGTVGGGLTAGLAPWVWILLVAAATALSYSVMIRLLSRQTIEELCAILPSRPTRIIRRVTFT